MKQTKVKSKVVHYVDPFDQEPPERYCANCDSKVPDNRWNHKAGCCLSCMSHAEYMAALMHKGDFDQITLWYDVMSNTAHIEIRTNGEPILVNQANTSDPLGFIKSITETFKMINWSISDIYKQGRWVSCVDINKPNGRY
ncbi:MAG: hypothetical protein KQI81_08860 [Deltaproteobacteria bacterium]|nr:hypothetical protein [Deltaproteobacteria bacterium]